MMVKKPRNLLALDERTIRGQTFGSVGSPLNRDIADAAERAAKTSRQRARELRARAGLAEEPAPGPIARGATATETKT